MELFKSEIKRNCETFFFCYAESSCGKVSKRLASEGLSCGVVVMCGVWCASHVWCVVCGVVVMCGVWCGSHVWCVVCGVVVMCGV